MDENIASFARRVQSLKEEIEDYRDGYEGENYEEVTSNLADCLDAMDMAVSSLQEIIEK